ncbi:MAG: FeoB-associated Cys-rich membrane protein [Bacteroidetes bacterium]|nr:MAG: FeoB-associated Cys-rich membrane protein [Bacteroidota bacterium]
MQDWITYIIVASAVAYLIYYILKKVRPAKKKNNCSNCNCH